MSKITIPSRYMKYWRAPWTVEARQSRAFRLWLGRQDLLTPHFSYTEARSKDGKNVPVTMRSRARDHAFKLEQLRHDLGDVPLPITSWYRSPEHNRAVGGAQFSQHMRAIAVDIPVEFVKKHPNFDKVADRIFTNGGFGQYPGGARHVDSRGTKARWTTFTPGK